MVIDLRVKRTDWPDLVSDNYTFCNGLGKEANLEGLGGFLAPSARKARGTTVPVFMQGSVENPDIEATVRLTFVGGKARVEVTLV
jgi:hypothetical protein